MMPADTTNGRLSQISTATSTYNFTYDSFGNVTEVDVGGDTLATYTYNANNGKLSSMTYGFYTEVEYFYDTLDRITKICYNDEERYVYQYTSDGKLHCVKDIESDVGYLYSYDGDDRVTGYTQYSLSDKTNTLAINYKYDEKSRLFEAVTTTDYYVGTNKADLQLLEQFIYDDDTDLVTYYQALFNNTNGDGLEGDFAYDAVQRLTSKNYTLSKNSSSVQNYISYTYNDVASRYGSRVTSYTTAVGIDATTYTYTYDSKGNIIRIVDSVLGSSRPVKYTYDDLNQLIREDNPYMNKSYVYTYDYNGNRTSKDTYAYTTGTLGTATYIDSYSYSDNNWGDMLTAYDGVIITYDYIGNPINYYNGSSYTFAWEDGRSLAFVDCDEGTYIFTYNDEGIRTSKTNYYYDVTHYYTLDGSQILTEQWDNKFIAYIYDENGAPIGMQYRTSSYAEGVFDYFYFEKNLQGDIIAVYNASGTKLVTYKYDAWGNHTATYSNGGGSTGAQYNPFRYRGYYYDIELELYYLNSRYYDSNTGRFISPDSFDVLTVTPGQLTDKNLYAYCDNNPITREDGDGEFWFLIGAIANVASQLISDIITSVVNEEIYISSPITYLSAAVSGAVSGPIKNPIVSGMVNSFISTVLEMNLTNLFSSNGQVYSFDRIFYTTVNNTLLGGMLACFDIVDSYESSGLTSKFLSCGAENNLSKFASNVFYSLPGATWSGVANSKIGKSFPTAHSWDRRPIRIH